jgi:hypothetical protein
MLIGFIQAISQRVLNHFLKLCIAWKVPNLMPEEAIVYTMALICLSGYSNIFLISSIVGILSPA